MVLPLNDQNATQVSRHQGEPGKPDPPAVEEILRAALSAYLRNAPETIVELRRAHAAADHTAIAQRAHALASSSTLVGASDLADLCFTIEREARNPDSPLLAQAIDGVPATFHRLAGVLEARLLAPEGAHEPSAHSESQKILVVADDPATRSLIQQLLTEQGFLCTAAEDDGTTPLTLAETMAPDLIIFEEKMTLADGYRTCAAIHHLPRLAQTPVLLLTGHNGPQSMHRAVEAGMTDFATKPISPPILIHRTRFLLRTSETLQKLRQSEIRSAEAQRMARLGHWEIDLATKRFSGSAQVMAMLGLDTRKAAHLDDYLALVHPADRGQLRTAIDDMVQGVHVDCRHRIIVAGGSPRRVHVRGELVRDAENEPSALRGTMQVLSHGARSHRRARHATHVDAMTGLPGRLMFIDRLSGLLSHAQRHRQQVAIMLIDLDDLRRINDTLGHEWGDAALIEVGRRLRQNLRVEDELSRCDGDCASSMVARSADDKFLIAIGDLSSGEDTAVVAARLLEAISAPMQHRGSEIFVSATIGISLFPVDGSAPTELIQRADMALHQAKEAGQNTFAFFDRSMNEASMVRLVLETGLRRAIDTYEMSAHYQPIVDAMSGRIVGVEALTRWRHPQLGLISPMQFIPLAERVGLIGKITTQTVRQVCDDMHRWATAALPGVHAAVNISAQQFRNPRLADELYCLVQEAGHVPQDFTLEVTESVLMENLEVGEKTLTDLKSHGFHLAIDDFGTGYSSLTYLKRFPIDIIKIDRTFIHGIDTNDRHATLAAAIVALAHGLGVDPVAEGVEKIEQRDVLVACGCTLMQGFLFATPMPGEELAALLARDGGRIEVEAVRDRARAA